MKNILVTGKNGQLGNEIQIVAKENPQFNYFFTDKNELNVTNEKEVIDFVNNNKIDCIINCAAYTNVDKAQDEIETANLVNFTAVKYLSAAMNNVDGLLIHISSDYVYNNFSNHPLKETDENLPISAYGWSKLNGDRAIISNCNKYIILRTSWLYSEYGKNFVKTMCKLGMEAEEIGVVYDQVGSPTYALDLAQAIFYILNSKNIKYGVYNYSNEGAISWYDFTKAIFELTGSNCKIKPLHSDEYNTKANRPYYSVLNKSKIKATYRIEIPYWKNSLVKCLKKIK